MSRQVPNQGIPVFGDDDPTVLLGMVSISFLNAQITTSRGPSHTPLPSPMLCTPHITHHNHACFNPLLADD